MNESEDIDLQLLRQLAQDPCRNQRCLADHMGMSLGKLNYCVRALVSKGLVKVSNFKRSNNKRAYAYWLTTEGLQEKSRLTISFLKAKQQEYDRLQVEIALLQIELKTLKQDHAVLGGPEAYRHEA